MKKKNILLVLIISVLFILPNIVFASGSSDDKTEVDPGEMITATCLYHNQETYDESTSKECYCIPDTDTCAMLRNPTWEYTQRSDMSMCNNGVYTKDNYTKFEFYGINGATYSSSGGAVDIEDFYYVNSSKRINTSVDFNGSNNIINYNKDLGVYFAVTTFQYNTYFDNSGSNEELKTAASNGNFCPKVVYTIIENNSYKYMFCNEYDENVKVQTCDTVSAYIKKNFGSATISRKEYTASSAISNIGTDDYSETDVKEVYAEVEEEKKDVCDKSSENYDEKKCIELSEISDSIVDQAEDQGIKEEELEEFYVSINAPEPSKITDCTSLLGSPQDKYSPAYYLNVVFKILRYVAIILLIVLSIMDFVGAVAAQDDDAIKKATNKTIKRLIFCVIIFVLPTLIEFVLQFIHDSAIDTCGIGS